MSKHNGYILQISFYCHAIISQYVEADPRKFQNKTTQGTQSYYDKQSKCLHGTLPGFEQSEWRQIGVMVPQIIANSTVCSIAFQARNKEKKSKLRITVSLWGEFSGDRDSMSLCHQVNKSPVKELYMIKTKPSAQRSHAHYNDVIMSTMAAQTTSLTIVYSTVYSGAERRIHQSSVTGLCVWNSPVTGEFPTQMAINAENVSIWWRHHDISWDILHFAL